MGAYTGVKMSSQGASSPIIVNITGSYSPYLSPNLLWALGLICTVSSGASLTYSVQVTADQQPSSSGNWNNHDVLVGLTASANGNVAYPITALRLNVTVYSSGTVNLGVAQWP